MLRNVTMAISLKLRPPKLIENHYFVP
jgi:hypothetical protein